MKTSKMFKKFGLLAIAFSAQLGWGQTVPVNSPPSSEAIILNGDNFVQSLDPNMFNLAQNSEMTFECWFNYCTVGVIFSKHHCNGTDAGYFLTMDVNGSLRFHQSFTPNCIPNNPDILTMSSTTTGLNDNQWHHVAIVYTYDINAGTSVATMYIDGDINTTVTGTGTYTSLVNPPNPTTTPFFIGGYINSNNNYVATPEGRIDEFRVYDRALSFTDLMQEDVDMAYLNINYPGIQIYEYQLDNPGGCRDGCTMVSR